MQLIGVSDFEIRVDFQVLLMYVIQNGSSSDML